VAEERGIEIALDIAFQASPDHPWVREHPEWFRQRADGTIQYAENPPKKYQDIYPINFESPQWRELWEELKSVFEFWIGHGVHIFRVDNPHTKPFAFWEWVIGELKREHPELRIVAFERNAGQTAAFAAGFRAARGRFVVTLDADLQNDPADVPRVVDALERSGATAVAGYRAARNDSKWKLLQSRIANGVRNWLNGETIRDTGCSLKAFRADAVRALPLFSGMHRFLPTLIKMHGGTVEEVPVRHRPRRFGVTKYGMWNRVFRSLADAFAVRWMQRRALKYRVREEVQ
jgi:glycosyltransferase involved in cell wall biosynthesis